MKQRLFWEMKYEATVQPTWRTRLGRDYGMNSRDTDNRKNVHSVQQKSSGLIFRMSRSGSDMTYSYHYY